MTPAESARTEPVTAAYAAALDAADPLARFRKRFVGAEDDLSYLEATRSGAPCG